MTQMPSPQSGWLPVPFRRAGRFAALVGLVGTAACLAVWIIFLFFDRHWAGGSAAFYKAYLFGWLFWLDVSLGALVAVMIHHLTGGEWGYFIRRPGEAAANVLPLMFVLFVPVLFGLHRIYPWAGPHSDYAVAAHRRPYLNPGFFAGRYVIYFAIWICFAWVLRTLSLRHDRDASPRTAKSLLRISAIGLVIYFITMSMAAIDWLMSLEPKWFSTIFALIICLGQGIAGVAFLIIMLQLLSQSSPFVERLRPRHFNDLATLLVTGLILWAYHSLSQLLIIWMGNIQGDIPWYVKRSHGPWRWMAGALVYVGFFAPFILLLQRAVKKKGQTLLWVCSGLLAIRLLENFWTIAPSGINPWPSINWFNVLMSLVAFIGIGGLWFAAFIWLLDRAPLMPTGDAVPIAIEPTPPTGHAPKVCEHGTESVQPNLA